MAPTYHCNKCQHDCVRVFFWAVTPGELLCMACGRHVTVSPPAGRLATPLEAANLADWPGPNEVPTGPYGEVLS